MPTLSQLESWVQAGESETLELKRSTAELKSGMQSLVGLLNHRGGRVLFGVDDSGKILGQTVADATLRDLAQEIGRIEPAIQPEIERVSVGENRQVIVVSVSRGQNRPYAYNGKAYKRVGNTTSELTREEYNRILLEGAHADSRWETQAADGWSVADLDGSEIIRTVEESIRRGRIEDPGTRDPLELLRGLGLVRDGQILRAAVVLFGRAEAVELRMPQCLLRVARFKGVDRTEFLDNRQFHGNAFELLHKGERFLRENLPVAGRVQPNLFERVDDPLYPPGALREALANALCHRDYSIGGGSISIGVYDDRLEITSSGQLHFGLTPPALFLPHESLPWNPLIARVFYRRGVIESWGRGTIKIAELTERAGLPRPDIEEVAGCVVVRFSPTRYVPPQRVAQNVTERQQRVLLCLSGSTDGRALREIRETMGAEVAEWEIKSDLTALKHLGLVRVTGHARWAKWLLA
jgi:ATP-dependent DNA helicase RecG